VGRKNKHNARLLEAAFSRPEWEYLRRDPDFKARLKAANITVEDFVELSLLGSKLLAKWEGENQSKPKFRRTSERSSKPGDTSD
jgi:hypothetical protein